jgi:glutaredoxin-related protein
MTKQEIGIGSLCHDCIEKVNLERRVNILFERVKILELEREAADRKVYQDTRALNYE